MSRLLSPDSAPKTEPPKMRRSRVLQYVKLPYGNAQLPDEPPIWHQFLHAIAAGRSAVGGAGAALALLGIGNAFLLLISSHRLSEIPTSVQETWLHLFSIGGAIFGGVLGWIKNR
jgi:hypothetical protein